MGLIGEQLVVLLLSDGLQLLVGAHRSVRQDVHVGLHARFLVEMAQAALELGRVVNPVAVLVGEVAGLVHGTGGKGRALHRGCGHIRARAATAAESHHQQQHEQHGRNDDEHRAASAVGGLALRGAGLRAIAAGAAARSGLLRAARLRGHLRRHRAATATAAAA